MTNHDYYLGTPALAAQFMAKVVSHCVLFADCDNDCPLFAAHVECADYKALKEWLESEAS